MDIRRRMSPLRPPKGSVLILPLQPRPSHSSPIPVGRLFKHFRTLSFSVSSLNPATPITSALLHSRQGGYTPTWSDQSSSLSAVGCHLKTVGFPLSPFPTSLTQKQGGTPSGHTNPNLLRRLSLSFAIQQSQIIHHRPPRPPQYKLQIPGLLAMMWPTLHAHFPASRAHAHPRSTSDCHRPARRIRVHQLHRSRQPFDCRADAERRAGHLRRAVGRAALGFFLEVRVPPSFLWLAGGQVERELGFCRRLPFVVRRDRRDRPRAHLRRALCAAAASWHGRGGQLSLVQQNHRAEFRGGASRRGEFRAGFGAAAGSGIRHALRRAADGALRMASVFHRARACEHALDFALAEVDAEETVCRAGGNSRRTESFRVSAAALGMGNVHRVALRKLCELFPDYLAAVLSGARAPLLHG